MARATTPCQMLRSSSAGWRRRSGLGAVARRHPATSLYPTTGLEGGLSIASVFWTGWCATQWEAHWSHKRIDAAVAACRGHGMLSAGLVSAVTANLCWPYEGADPAASDRNAPPFGQGGRSAGLVGLAIDEMTFGIEMGRKRMRGLRRTSEVTSSVRTGASPVPVAGKASANSRPDWYCSAPHRGGIRAQTVGDDPFRFSMALQGLLHEAQASKFIALLGHVAFENLALMIDRAPEVMQLAIYPNVHLVQVPTPVVIPAHPVDPLAAKIGPKRFHQSRPFRGTGQCRARGAGPLRCANSTGNGRTAAP